MILLLLLGYVVIGATEIWLWSERPWKKVLAYLCTLMAGATLSVLVMSNWELPLPQPLRMLGNWLEKLWSGGGL